MGQRDLRWLESSENEFGAVLDRIQRLDPDYLYYGAFRVRWMTGLPT